MTADLVRHALDNLPAFIPDAFERQCPDLHRYATDPAFRAAVDADRAARQAEVYARMDAAIERVRGPHPWKD